MGDKQTPAVILWEIIITVGIGYWLYLQQIEMPNNVWDFFQAVFRGIILLLLAYFIVPIAAMFMALFSNLFVFYLTQKTHGFWLWISSILGIVLMCAFFMLLSQCGCSTKEHVSKDGETYIEHIEPKW